MQCKASLLENDLNGSDCCVLVNKACKTKVIFLMALHPPLGSPPPSKNTHTFLAGTPIA